MKNKRRYKKSSVAKTIFLGVVMLAAAVAFAIGGKEGILHDRSVSVVKISLDAKVQIRPVLCSSKQVSDAFPELMKELKPYAAINGTYYDDSFKPIGDILIDGKLVNRGGQKNAIAIKKNGKVRFIHRGRRGFDWSGCTAGLAAGPRLVHKGKVALDPTADGFSKRSLQIEARRSGVGLTAKGSLLLITVNRNIKLKEFARIMLDLGAVEAMNLDGGGACALYHDGKTITSPTLPMTNLLVVYKKQGTDNR